MHALYELHAGRARLAAARYRAVVAHAESAGWSTPRHRTACRAATAVAEHWATAADAAAPGPARDGAAWSADRVHDLAERHAVAAELTATLAGMELPR